MSCEWCAEIVKGCFMYRCRLVLIEEAMKHVASNEDLLRAEPRSKDGAGKRRQHSPG